MIRRLRGVVLLLALGTTAAVLCGCATFRGGLVEPVQSWPPAASQTRKSIAITVRMERQVDIGPNHGPAPVSDDELNQFRGRVWAEYEDSGLFSDVKTGLENADLRADVQIDNHQEGSLGLAILSGLTLVMVPLKTNVDELMFTTTFKDSDGRVLATIEKKEKLNTWFQLFLIAVAPFKNVISQYDNATTDLVRSTIEEAHSRNII